MNSQLPDADQLAAVTRFYVDALGGTPLAIEPLAVNKARPDRRGFRVSYDASPQKTNVTIDAVSGVIMSYINSGVLQEDAAGIIQEYFPGEYPAYLEYLKTLRKEREEQAARAAALPRSESPFLKALAPPQADETKAPPAPLPVAPPVQVDQQARLQRQEEDRKWVRLKEWKPQYEKFPREKVFEQIKPVLAFFGQPLDMSGYVFREGSGPDPMSSTVMRPFQHNGVPFHGKRLSIEVSRYSGRIVSIFHDPITQVPKEVASPISKGDALKVASKSVRKNEFFKWRFFKLPQTYNVDFDVDTENITKVIALPKPGVGMSARECAHIETLSPTEPRYCWKVPFLYTVDYCDYDGPQEKLKWPFAVYVDMETGKTICAEAMFLL